MKKLILFTLISFLALNTHAQSNWHYLPNAPSGTWRIDDVFFLNSQLGWCASSGGQIHRTTDGGAHWELMYTSSDYFRCIEFYNDSIGYAGTLNNHFLRTTDGGSTWTDLASAITPSPAAVCGISIVDSLYAYAVGEWDTPGFFLKTTDGGISWTSHSMASYATALVDVYFLSRDTGFVTGQSVHGAIILYTTNGGTSWTKKFDSGVSGQYVWKIQGVTSDFWVGSIQTFGGGKYAKSYDGGQTWAKFNAPVPDMQGIGFATPQHGWVGGYVNGFYETFDSGANWEFKDFGGNFNRFYFLDSTLAFASGLSIYKFSDTSASTVSQPRPSNLNDDGFEISLSPNPTSQYLEIKFHLPVQDNLRMGIYSPDGAMLREVYHERMLSPDDYSFRVDCTSLPSGAYFLGVQRNCGLYVRPFAKL